MRCSKVGASLRATTAIQPHSATARAFLAGARELTVGSWQLARPSRSPCCVLFQRGMNCGGERVARVTVALHSLPARRAAAASYVAVLTFGCIGPKSQDGPPNPVTDGCGDDTGV